DRDFTGLETDDANVGILPTERVRTLRKKYRFSAWQNLRPAANGVGVRLRQRLRCAAGRGNTHQARTDVRREDDVAVLTPTATPGGPRIAQCHRGAALHRHLLQLSAREEPDPLPVGREERVGAALGPGHGCGERLIERSRCELDYAARRTYREHDTRAVRRENGSRARAGHSIRPQIHAEPNQRPIHRTRRTPPAESRYTDAQGQHGGHRPRDPPTVLDSVFTDRVDRILKDDPRLANIPQPVPHIPIKTP